MSFEKWEDVKIGDVLLKIVGGGTPSKDIDNYWNGDIFWCSVKDMKEDSFRLYQTEDTITLDGLKNSSSNLISKNTVITATRMGLGRAFINKVDMAINQDLKALIPNEKIDNEFLLWSIINVKDYIELLGNGATVKGIRLETLKAIKIKLPPLPTQKKIAKILSNYDDLIENNLKQIKLLEEKARLTYEEWFLRFRIDGQKLEIDEETGLPFGWVKKKVGDLLGKVKSTVKIKTSDILSTGKYPVIDQSKDFVAGYTNEADINQYNDIPYIVFGDHTRVLKFVNFSFAKGADGTQVLISNSPRMPQVMFYHALINVDLSNYHYARHYKFLKAEEIIVPTLELAQRYEIFGNTIFDQIKNLRNQNNLLKESRDILLPRLMTGMIDIEKLDIEV